MSKRVAKFEKVSIEQFITDWKDTFNEENEEVIKAIYENLKLPRRATSGSAGYDFYAPTHIILQPHETIKIPTGIRCKIDDEWVLKCYPRSGLGFKYRLQLNNTVGIIDSDYFYSDNEGHIFAKVTNDTNESKTYRYSDTNEGTLELINNYIFAKVTYTVKVYSVDSSCQNMLLKTLKASTIKFNDYSKYDACDGYEEFELCKPFYDGEHVSKEVFNNALEEYKKEKETTFFEKVIKIIKEYYLYVLLPIAIISACYYTYIGVIKWRKRK